MSAALHVRPLRAGDDAEVRRIFRDTVVLGHAVAFDLHDLDRYEALCLDWYLTEGRAHGAVLVRHGDDGTETVAGYLLVCPDGARHDRWVRRRAARFTARVLAGLALRRYDAAERTFWRLRLQDGWRAWRRGPAAPLAMHVHLNLDPAVRATSAGRLLVAHADAVCLAHGLPGWYGEVNATAGHRAGAFERLGAVVVDRTPNLTFTWAAGQPVERLTVVRVVGDDQPSRLARRRSTVTSSTPMAAT